MFGKFHTLIILRKTIKNIILYCVHLKRYYMLGRSLVLFSNHSLQFERLVVYFQWDSFPCVQSKYPTPLQTLCTKNLDFFAMKVKTNGYKTRSSAHKFETNHKNIIFSFFLHSNKSLYEYFFTCAIFILDPHD